MAHTEQLNWERRMAPYATGAAVAAALFTLASGILASSVLTSAANEAQYLTEIQHRAGPWLIAGILQALGLVAVPGALIYLYRVIKYRRPGTPQPALVFTLAGALLSAIVAIWLRVAEVNAAHQFAGAGAHPAKPAATILTDATDTIRIFGLAGSLALAAATVLLSMNAIRAGILSRFMGIVGVIIGALYIVPLSPVLPVFWFGALALLFMNRWPNGRGPAWETAEATPWPSPQRRGQTDSGGTDTATSNPSQDASQNGEARGRSRRKKKHRALKRPEAND